MHSENLAVDILEARFSPRRFKNPAGEDFEKSQGGGYTCKVVIAGAMLVHELQFPKQLLVFYAMLRRELKYVNGT